MSGTVMLAFGFYLVLSQYGWALMTGSTMYMVGMVLQTTSALSILIAAGVTTTLLSPDMETPKRALIVSNLTFDAAVIFVNTLFQCLNH